MEQNSPLVAKKVWSLVRVMLFVLRKNMSKQKLLLDLNMLMKRGKLAGKTLQNLMFHHHHKSSNFTFTPPRTEDYEFSCSNSPVYPLSLFSSQKKHNHKKNSQKKSATKEDHEEIYVDAVLMKALELLTSATTSPALSGFGKSPMGRQLRISDSPFPLSNEDEDYHVDEAAEKFIMKFYNELRREN